MWKLMFLQSCNAFWKHQNIWVLISDKTPSIIYADLESWFNPSCPDPGQKEKN